MVVVFVVAHVCALTCTVCSKTKECAVNDSNIVTQVSIQLAIDIITLVLPTMKKRPYWQHR